MATFQISLKTKGSSDWLTNPMGWLLQWLTKSFLKQASKFSNQPPAFNHLFLTSSTYSLGRGTPATTVGPPPCILRALIVATRTTALGTRPEFRHLMLKNFSMPMSAPNPASVTGNEERQLFYLFCLFTSPPTPLQFLTQKRLNVNIQTTSQIYLKPPFYYPSNWLPSSELGQKWKHKETKLWTKHGNQNGLKVTASTKMVTSHHHLF